MRVPGGSVSPAATGATRLLALAGWLALFATPALLGQNPPAELSTHDEQPAFKVEVERNLVLVRAVARDSKGRAVPNLRKEDFQLFDSGKLQVISHFSVEGPTSKPEPQKNPPAKGPPELAASSETAQAAFTPLRYTAWFFDDVHASFEDLVHSRDAADRYLASALQPSERVGLFTVSGQNNLDFTDNHAKLHAALFRLQPRPIVPEIDPAACPDILQYQAYQIVHQRDPFAIAIAEEEILACRYNNDPQFEAEARAESESQAVHVLSLYETESEASLHGLEELVRRMAILPGQRNIVMVSPGFLTASQKSRMNEVSDRALRSGVIINTYDAKGLYAPIPLGDASKGVFAVPGHMDLVGRKSMIYLEQIRSSQEVLRDIATDTGGIFFHDSNDFDGGFRLVSSRPEVYYVLGFSPSNLKYDGRFHSIKVKLMASANISLQARRGYFAPRTAPDEAAKAKEDIQNALFSEQQLSELPVEIHTQFFKTGEQGAKLSVLAHLDLRSVSFRKQEGRNRNDLTVVTALFDRDGKYLTANQKVLEFRLRDTTLERLSHSGLTMKTSFDVKPGTYLVRLVVRDSQGGQLSGLSRTIEIPF